MNYEMVEEKDNLFLKRKELKIIIKHPKQATPKKDEIVSELSEKYKKEKDCVIVDYIFTKKGLNESLARVKIYEEKPKKKERPKEVKEKVKESKPEERAEGEKDETQTSKTK